LSISIITLLLVEFGKKYIDRSLKDKQKSIQKLIEFIFKGLEPHINVEIISHSFITLYFTFLRQNLYLKQLSIICRLIKQPLLICMKVPARINQHWISKGLLRRHSILWSRQKNLLSPLNALNGLLIASINRHLSNSSRAWKKPKQPCRIALFWALRVLLGKLWMHATHNANANVLVFTAICTHRHAFMSSKLTMAAHRMDLSTTSSTATTTTTATTITTAATALQFPTQVMRITWAMEVTPTRKTAVIRTAMEWQTKDCMLLLIYPLNHSTTTRVSRRRALRRTPKLASKVSSANLTLNFKDLRAELPTWFACLPGSLLLCSSSLFDNWSELKKEIFSNCIR